MSESPDQIQDHIRHTREDLSANLNELEHKVKSVADWRQHFERSPGVFLAVALGGGLLLAVATNRRRSAAPATSVLHSLPPTLGQAAQQGGETVGQIKSALIGLVASHAKNILTQVLPGFQAQVAEAQKSAQRPDVEQRMPPAEQQVPPSGNGSVN